VEKVVVTGVEGRREDDTEDVMPEEEALRTTRVGVEVEGNEATGVDDKEEGDTERDALVDKDDDEEEAPVAAIKSLKALGISFKILLGFTAKLVTEGVEDDDGLETILLSDFLTSADDEDKEFL
jgi:hypothetical protein